MVNGHAIHRGRLPLSSSQGAVAPSILVEVLDSRVAWAEPKDLPIQTLCTASDVIPASSRRAITGQRAISSGTTKIVPKSMLQLADGSVHCLPAGCLSGHQPRSRPNWPNIAALAVWLPRSACCWSARCGAGRPGLPEVVTGSTSLDCPPKRAFTGLAGSGRLGYGLCGAYSPPKLGIARVSPLTEARHGAYYGIKSPARGFRVHAIPEVSPGESKPATSGRN